MSLWFENSFWLGFWGSSICPAEFLCWYSVKLFHVHMWNYWIQQNNQLIDYLLVIMRWCVSHTDITNKSLSIETSNVSRNSTLFKILWVLIIDFRPNLRYLKVNIKASNSYQGFWSGLWVWGLGIFFWKRNNIIFSSKMSSLKIVVTLDLTMYGKVGQYFFSK